MCRHLHIQRLHRPLYTPPSCAQLTRPLTTHRNLLLLFVFCLTCSIPAAAWARDIRIALLVGNQQGWKKDPTLRYALSGDLRPMSRALRSFGFTVHTLENQSPQKLRETFLKLQARVSRAPRVTTFLFYYTGHADRIYLHQGPKGKAPVSYRELVGFFKRLRVRRRFVILDSCFSGELIRKFGSLQRYRELVPKGARARRMVDLSQSIPNQGDEQSLQIISSGVALSWESTRYKASIFTHHMLEGLRGPADRDIDGKISMGELFDYVSSAMKRDINQKPQLFGVIKRSQTYALAPAYSSRLWIGPKVLGKLYVSVANFSWSWRKRQQRPLRLSLIHGKGTVDLVKGGGCWRQALSFPKGGEARLGGRWSKVHCKEATRLSKGQIQLDMQFPPTAPRSQWQLQAQGSLLGLTLDRPLLFAGGEFGVRFGFLGLRLGVRGASPQIGDTHYQQLLIDLQLDAGWRPRWSWFELFLGGGLSAGVLLQDLNETQGMSVGTILRAGLILRPTFWVSSNWALTLQQEAGVVLSYSRANLTPRFGWNSSIGLLYHFD